LNAAESEATGTEALGAEAGVDTGGMIVSWYRLLAILTWISRYSVNENVFILVPLEIGTKRAWLPPLPVIFRLYMLGDIAKDTRRLMPLCLCKMLILRS